MANLSACLSAMLESNALENSFLLSQLHLQNVQVSFVCQGHSVKVKVTGAKSVSMCHVSG